MSHQHQRWSRRGTASVWALIVLAIVSALSATAIAQFAGARRQVDGQRNRLQAEWLARSGYELAIARLLDDAKEYSGETFASPTGGEIKIAVMIDPKEKGTYRIESEGRYPTGDKGVVVRIVRRAVKRDDGAGGTRFEAIGD